MRFLVIVALSAAALAGCGPQAKVVTPAQLPHVKPGLWEETVTDNGSPMEPSRDCSDGALHLPGALMPAGCTSQPVITQAGNGEIAVDWSCSASGATTIEHTTVSGDFTTGYVIDSTTTMTASGGAPQVLTSHQSFKYVGACPPESGAPPEAPD